MPLFVRLAGFFNTLSLSKRDVGNYAINRLIRLSVLFLLLWSVIPAIDEKAREVFKKPELISWLSYNLPFTLRLYHLWFLYYLILFHFTLLSIKTAAPLIYPVFVDHKLSLSRVLILWLPVLILLSPLHKPTAGIF